MALAEFAPLGGLSQVANKSQYCKLRGPQHQSHIVVPLIISMSGT